MIMDKVRCMDMQTGKHIGYFQKILPQILHNQNTGILTPEYTLSSPILTDR